MRVSIRPNKNDGTCLTCELYVRCSASDKARGMACSNFKRKEKNDGRENVKREMDQSRN